MRSGSRIDACAHTATSRARFDRPRQESQWTFVSGGGGARFVVVTLAKKKHGGWRQLGVSNNGLPEVTCEVRMRVG